MIHNRAGKLNVQPFNSYPLGEGLTDQCEVTVCIYMFSYFMCVMDKLLQTKMWGQGGGYLIRYKAGIDPESSPRPVSFWFGDFRFFWPCRLYKNEILMLKLNKNHRK